jgi:ABC-2 type transport system permease protein
MTAAQVESRTGYRVTFGRVVRSEWTKLRSLRSTWIVLGAGGLLTIGIAGVIGWNSSRQDEPTTVAETVAGAFLAVDLMALVLGVFGILLMTGEYGSGLIRATLAAVPRRLPVLWAKALALVAAGVPVMLAVSFGSFLLHQAFAEAGVRVTLGDPEVLRAALGAAAAPILSGLLGLGLGAAMRHTAGTITSYVVGMLVLPGLLPVALPDSIQDDVVRYTPVASAQAMYAVGDGGNPFDMLSPGAGALVTLGWAGLLLTAGAIVLRRRDA